MLKRIIPLAFVFSAFQANAAIITDTGVSVVSDNGDGTYTFTFDTGFTTDRLNKDGSGLTFSGYGIDLTVTGSDDVIQDWPAHGGLGVDGGAGGDNLAGAEWLRFDIGGGLFDFVGFSLNGSHQDEFADNYPCNAVNATTSSWAGQRGWCAQDQDVAHAVYADIYDDDYPNHNDKYDDVSWVSFTQYDSRHTFSGYIESFTIRASAVPEPGSLALLGLGLAGLGFSRRKANKA